MYRTLRVTGKASYVFTGSLLQYAGPTILCRSGTFHNRCFSATSGRRIMETTGFTENQMTVREAVATLCAKFPNSYWQEHDRNEEDPTEFHAALAKDGWLGIALPEELGGSGLGISEATMMMQTIAESGAGMAGAQSIHANVYATQPLAKFGTKKQREHTIPRIIAGEWRTCFGVTEPDTGLDTLRLRTAARKSADGQSYSVTGQKIWITCAQVARKMMLLARTTPLEEVRKPSEGLSLFCIDLDRPSSSSASSSSTGLEMRKIKKMGGRAVDANEVFFDNYQIPADALVGTENQGFRAILHGMNAERCLLAGEALGLGYAAVARAAGYARERVVFGRPIGANQGIAHPLADAYMRLEAAKLVSSFPWVYFLTVFSLSIHTSLSRGGCRACGSGRHFPPTRYLLPKASNAFYSEEERPILTTEYQNRQRTTQPGCTTEAPRQKRKGRRVATIRM